MAHWFEFLAPLGPLVASLTVGFAVIGMDGQVYLTAAGSRYLESKQ